MELPANVEAERQVLGLLIMEPENAPQAMARLTDKEFYDQYNRKLFRAIKELFDSNKSINLGNLSEYEFKPYELTEIANEACVPSQAEQLSDLIKNHAIHRDLIVNLKQFTQDSMNAEDPQKFIDEVTDKLTGLITHRESDYKTNYDLMMEIMDNLEARQEGGGVTGIPTDFYDLDNLTAGLHRKQLIFLFAVPKMGKSAIALDIMINIAKKGYSGLYTTLEMPSNELGDRQIAMESKVNSNKIRTGKINQDFKQLMTSASELSKLKIGWIEKPGITITELKAVARRYKMEHGLDFLVVDQLDKLATKIKSGENNSDAIKRNTVALKVLAQELDCTVLCLGQLLDKQVSNRETPRPRHGDEKGSSAPSEDADMVMYLWRPEFYWPEKYKGMAELIIARQRGGPTGSIWLTWQPQFTKFQNMPREEWPEEVTR